MLVSFRVFVLTAIRMPNGGSFHTNATLVVRLTSMNELLFFSWFYFFLQRKRRANNAELVIDTIWFDFSLAALAGLFTARLNCRRILFGFYLIWRFYYLALEENTNSSLRVYHKRDSLNRVGCVCWKHVQMHIVHYSRPDLS